MPDIRISRNRLSFLLRVMQGLLIPAAILAAIVAWLLRPASLDVRIEVQQFSLPRYDDHAGNLPLGATVTITNFSKSEAWFLGFPGVPDYEVQQLIDGNWQSSMSSTRLSQADDTLRPKQWTALRTMESITILAGPLSEKTTEFRVGLPFTTERLAPTKAHWIFSPAVKIIKRGHDYFAERKPGAQQEDQVLSLYLPGDSKGAVMGQGVQTTDTKENRTPRESGDNR